MAFKPRTVFPDYNIPLNNFKGHHQKALSKLGHLAPQLDLVLEIRDCRAPVSTTNVLFDKVLARKKKLILYSKKDLSILNSPLLDKWHKPRNEEYMFVDCRSPVDATRVIKKLRNLYNKMDSPPPLGLRTMIVGMPNVGKSSMVNLLRQVGLERDGSTKFRKVARTGHQPGVTRNTSEIIRISEEPDILMYDTPGVFVPTARSVETMLALGLVGSIPESYVDSVILADYLLYVLNLQDPSGKLYKECIDHPTNDIYELLESLERKKNVKNKPRKFDEEGLAMHWIANWKQAKGNRYRGCFDVEAIRQVNESTFTNIMEQERQRLSTTGVHKRITDSFGEDGTSTNKHRKRTAKDREYDLKNRLFKL